ncbi:hypothetical protein Ahy_A06g026296 [Arachis hypogaea]|uniref:Uncharacterized protein n=1 Tax=Arachis hypogaea TaxID=3818 RepID=A0A445CK41_ARAHY|nr:hypothetical protein Ahy_A06g026296 [Arachis hypogaea]
MACQEEQSIEGKVVSINPDEDGGFAAENFNLVGKILSDKEVSFNSCKAAILGIRGHPEGVAISDVGRNKLLISVKDVQKGIQIRNGWPWSVDFKYERIQDSYCLNCGILGHTKKEYRNPMAMASWDHMKPRYGLGLGVNRARAISARGKEQDEKQMYREWTEAKQDCEGEHARMEHMKEHSAEESSTGRGLQTGPLRNLEANSDQQTALGRESQGSRLHVEAGKTLRRGDKFANTRTHIKKGQLWSYRDKPKMKRIIAAAGRTMIQRMDNGEEYYVELAEEQHQMEGKTAAGSEQRNESQRMLELAFDMWLNLNSKRIRDTSSPAVYVDKLEDDELLRMENSAQISTVNNNVWEGIFVYGHPDFKRRKELWNELTCVDNNLHVPRAFIGDFNDVIAQHEKVGLHPKPTSQIDTFRCFVDKNALMDLELQGTKYTWFSNPRNGFVTKERIDRDFLLRNGRWLIGNGEKVSILDDNWILNMKKSPDVMNNDVTFVKELISEGQGWNINELRKHFDGDTTVKIIRTPVSVTGREDKFSWPLKPDEKYTIKTGYHAARKEQHLDNNNSPSTSDDFRDLWRDIWKLKVPQDQNLSMAGLA